MSDWDGTPWAGTEVRNPYPSGRPDGMAEVQGKAAIGPGVGFYGPNSVSLSSTLRSPQALMKAAQQATHTNPWIKSAEAAVTRRVKGLGWHLEDGAGNEYPRDGTVPPEVKAAYDLLEKPLGRLSVDDRLPSPITTYDRLMGITSRHIGPCGMAYWFLDQTDVNGIPLNILYINPARMWDSKDALGNLTGWVIDPKDNEGNGGTPLSLSEVIPFYLDPPDWGHIGSGLYEAAILKATITNLADQHSAYVLGTGGRIAGIVAPKEGSIPDDKFKVLLNEFRNVNEAPDAAKRTTIMQGPTDFLKTAADPSELNLVELAKMNRDDIFAIWGIPPTQGSIPAPGGLNSGETKGYDEAILMQGAVHDRVKAIGDTIQFLLLDRWQRMGTTINLVIDEPEFDDDTPKYDLASKALNLPLKNIERRAIIGHEPFGDDRDEEVWLPSTQTVAYEASGKPPEPAPVPQALAPFAGSPLDQPIAEAPVKAGRREFLGLRKTLDTRWVPATQKRVQGVLAIQAHEAAGKVRNASAKSISDNVKRPEYWFATKREDDRMLAALRPGAVGIATTVSTRMGELLSRKATFEDKVASYIAGKLGSRVKGINDTTRQAIAAAIEQGFADGLSPAQIGDLVEALPAFDDSRAELVARTETMTAYNAAALASYQEYGVEQVEAIDGDDDEVCAARDGSVFTVAEAEAVEDHPNGTLDWAPYFATAKASWDNQTKSSRVRMTPLPGGGWELEEIA